jgi:hypothetical protein
MGEARRALERRVERFVDDVEALVRRATLHAVAQALEVRAAEAGAGRGPKTPPEAAEPPRRRQPSPARARALRQMEAYLAEHPGARMREIARALGYRSDFLQPLMRRLLEAGTVRKEGRRSATRYFPSGPR